MPPSPDDEVLPYCTFSMRGASQRRMGAAEIEAPRRKVRMPLASTSDRL